jgi:Alpha-L-arabinofuranosidase B (ABFB) domain
MSNLIARWGAPSWNRVKSYNYPDRYVRHQNNVGRIDPYPFDPYQDQQWTLVAGLADPAGVSFRSVNYPTMYLRHYNYELTLATNDGSGQFAADATFYRAAGFADASWTSFRSYNFPDRYLRHYNFVLRIDPISGSSSSVDKQDATFRVGY